MKKYFTRPVERAKVIFFLSVAILTYTQITIDYKPYGKSEDLISEESLLIRNITAIEKASIIEDFDDPIFPTSELKLNTHSEKDTIKSKMFQNGKINKTY